MTTDYVNVTRRENRSGLLSELDIGESVSISSRIDLSFGLPEKRIRDEVDRLRQTLDTQVSRVRRKFREREYIVENGSFITPRQGVVITAVATRLL